MKKMRQGTLWAFLALAVLVLMALVGPGQALAETAEDAVGDVVTKIVGTGDDCGIGDYKATDELTADDKNSSTQENHQSADLAGATYTTSLLQSAEWTNKDAGEAELNIHYTATDTDSSNARSLYVFTTCTGHSFTEQIAIENIIELMEYNEYVDVIVVGANNRASAVDWMSGEAVLTTADTAAASMFSLRASDFEGLDDGIGYLTTSGTTTTYAEGAPDTKAAIIMEVLETYTNAGMIGNTYVHEIGCASNEEGCCTEGYQEDEQYESEGEREEGHYYDGRSQGYGPYIEVLYCTIDAWQDDEGHFTFVVENENYETAAEFVLSFGNQRHAGEMFTLYYIAQYVDMIEHERGYDFGVTVQAIFNSFDAFATAGRNLDAAFPSETLCEQLKTYTGVDLTAGATISLSDLTEDCQAAISKLQEYTEEHRYVVLIPDDGDANSNIYNFDSSFNDYVGSATSLDQSVNTLLYSLAMINPVDTVNDLSGARELIEGWITSGAVLTLEDFKAYNENVYPYSEDLKTSGALDVYATSTVTITTTVASEFELDADEDGNHDITVKNSGDASSSFEYDIVSVEPGDEGTVVTIAFTNLSVDDEGAGTTDDWIIDISIPVKLKDNTEFRTDEDWFKDTNVGATTAALAKGHAHASEDDSSLHEMRTETAAVASPKLYKASALSIEDGDTFDPDDPDEGEEAVDEDGLGDEEASDDQSDEASIPRTGDASGVVALVALAGVVAACIGVVLYRRRR